ncbi:LacI family DNA-binding transcriptional regulator [Zhihengliuella salsuginis]|uniref:LacI family transcriptional regulator n=1 Tax=Zhihengliuella salsuginis TaxID=578222 RepID=A0ABQ3GJD0_9MICC|nr:LacI family DNA-binding transcriptional regulator [Zhihengliuella salsuginis]GHD10435.1 LacI family transcriptional regulator [Zhihengliuella salsuginis]
MSADPSEDAPGTSPVSGATQSDLARELGVSRTLVSLALRGRAGVSPAMRRRILETADRRGYRRNTMAAELAGRRRTSVGLHLLDARNEIYSTILHSVQEELAGRERRLVLAVDSAPEHPDPRAVDTLLEANVGVVISTAVIGSEADIAALTARVPLIAMFRRVPGVDSISSDDDVGARRAVEHLADLGHRRIAHLTGPLFSGHSDRRESYQRSMSAMGAPADVVEADGYSRDAGLSAARGLLERPPGHRPSAVFAHNDELALAIREAAADLGLSIPGDLSLVGYDNSRTAGLTGIDLTTVDVAAADLGRAAAAAALRRLEDPAAAVVDRRFAPHLVVRGSTGAPRES